jgi:hypothetical protein
MAANKMADDTYAHELAREIIPKCSQVKWRPSHL